MSPIDVGGALPPPPPPPRDEDRDRTDREKDKARDDRAQRFLKTVQESANQGRERLAQQDAAVKKQAEHEASDRDVASERSDRERGESGRGSELGGAAEKTGAKSTKRGENEGGAREARRAVDASNAAIADQRRGAANRDVARGADASAAVPARGASSEEPAAKSSEATREKSDSGPKSGKRERKESAPGIEKPIESAPVRSQSGPASSTVAPDAAAKMPAEEPSIPRGIVRQAVEFAAFSERGGVIEFTLGLAGGPTLTLAALGNKKIQIRVDHRGATTVNGKTITRADLDELIARMRERGIDVTEVELC